MKGILSVSENTARRSHWVAQLKSGLKTEWDAEITHEVPGSMMSWESIKGSQVKTRGTIWFTQCPLNRGTVVSLSMDYDIPGGVLTEWATMLTGEDPDSLAITNLHRLKAYLETGEIPTIDGQSSGREEDVPPPLKH